MTRLFRRAALRAFAVMMPERAADWFENALLRPRPAPPLAAPEPITRPVTQRFPYGWGWIAVRVWGQGERPAVLLLHGWGGTSQSLGAFVDPLMAAGYRVVTFDFPAHGTTPGERTNLIECGGAALQIGSVFAPLAGIITHSFGGPAAALAMAHGLDAERVVMLGPPVGMREISFPVADRIGLPRAISERMFDRFAQRLRFTWDEIGTERLVAGCTAPLLVIHDEQDELVPWSHGDAIARGARDGRLVTTSGLGHRGTLIDATVVKTAVEFVTSR
jgi:pimeloyl-ACP methyl ester carboxylesterase